MMADLKEDKANATALYESEKDDMYEYENDFC
jgi:hypothetical protein